MRCCNGGLMVLRQKVKYEGDLQVIDYSTRDWIDGGI